MSCRTFNSTLRVACCGGGERWHVLFCRMVYTMLEACLGFNHPLIAMGLLGKDANALIIKKHCKKNNIQIVKVTAAEKHDNYLGESPETTSNTNRTKT